jgi:hypothetical protein
MLYVISFLLLLSLPRPFVPYLVLFHTILWLVFFSSFFIPFILFKKYIKIWEHVGGSAKNSSFTVIIGRLPRFTI